MWRELNKLQRMVLVVAWLGWVFDVMEASLFALTKAPMLTEMLGPEKFKTDGAAIGSWIHASMLLGWSLGGLIFGVVADRWGRSRTLILTVFIYCLFTGLTALCRTPEQVMLARFLTGLGIGGEWAAGAALIAETVPNSLRARAAAFLQTAAAFGSMIGVLANFTLGSANWRFVYLVGIAPAILCLVARSKLEPDSPTATLKRDWLAPIKELLSTRPYNRRLVIAILIGVVGVTGAGIAPFWLPDLVAGAMPGALDSEISGMKNWATLALHTGTLGGVLVFPVLCDRYGRRKMFATFFVCAAVMMVVAAVNAKSLTAIFLLYPVVSFFAIGVTAGFGLYFPELFAKAFRATGSGLAYNTGRILSAPIPILIGSMTKSYGVAIAVGSASCVYLIALVALLFAPETKGQTLEG